MPRSTNIQKVEHINVAHGLLARGLSITEVAVILSRQFALSRRQAYRYIQKAQTLASPLPTVEPTVVATFKLPTDLIRDLRARAETDGLTISETVTRAISAFLVDTDLHG